MGDPNSAKGSGKWKGGRKGKEGKIELVLSDEDAPTDAGTAMGPVSDEPAVLEASTDVGAPFGSAGAGPSSTVSTGVEST